MTDHELLEAAAKAAGIDGVYGTASDDYYYEGNVEGILTILPNGRSYVWNPLTDDGDALRLFACMQFCELYVSEIGATVFLPRRGQGEGPNLKCDDSVHETNGDLQAAIRRAIVRAAAEIGRRNHE